MPNDQCHPIARTVTWIEKSDAQRAKKKTAAFQSIAQNATAQRAATLKYTFND